jgi:hypothetical protein
LMGLVESTGHGNPVGSTGAARGCINQPATGLNQPH